MKFTLIAPALAAGIAGVAILFSPIASAAGESCAGTGGGTVCQSPGNAQINDAPGPVQFFPYGGEAFLVGGGGFGGGGPHGGHR